MFDRSHPQQPHPQLLIGPISCLVRALQAEFAALAGFLRLQVLADLTDVWESVSDVRNAGAVFLLCPRTRAELVEMHARREWLLNRRIVLVLPPLHGPLHTQVWDLHPRMVFAASPHVPSVVAVLSKMMGLPEPLSATRKPASTTQ